MKESQIALKTIQLLLLIHYRDTFTNNFNFTTIINDKKIMMETNCIVSTSVYRVYSNTTVSKGNIPLLQEHAKLAITSG